MEFEDFLAHYGKKGMKWGQQNANPVSVSNKTGLSYKDYKKDPTFKREVKATYRGKGIEQGVSWKNYTKTNQKGELVKNSNLKIGELNGKFKNSKQEKISKDFAAAVIKATNRKAARQVLGASAGFAAVYAGAAWLATKTI